MKVSCDTKRVLSIQMLEKIERNRKVLGGMAKRTLKSQCKSQDPNSGHPNSGHTGKAE